MIRRALLLATMSMWIGAAGPPSEIDAAGARDAEIVAGPEMEEPEALASTLDTLDAGLQTAATEVLGAETREREAVIGLMVQRDDLSRLLGLMQASSQSAEQARRMHPGGPLDAARAEAMLQAMGPPMRGQAAGVRISLEEIASARETQMTRRAQLESGLGERARLGARLVEAIESRIAARPVNPATGALADALAESASLEELSAALSRASAQERSARRSLSPMLASARIALAFREPDGAGVRRPGFLLAAAPLSPVRAPAGGVVRYAGPFLDYGRVLVLDADGGARIVVAGLPRLLARTGDRLARGALIGALGGRSLNVEEYLALTSGITRAGEIGRAHV